MTSASSDQDGRPSGVLIDFLLQLIAKSEFACSDNFYIRVKLTTTTDRCCSIFGLVAAHWLFNCDRLMAAVRSVTRNGSHFGAVDASLSVRQSGAKHTEA